MTPIEIAPEERVVFSHLAQPVVTVLFSLPYFQLILLRILLAQLLSFFSSFCSIKEKEE